MCAAPGSKTVQIMNMLSKKHQERAADAEGLSLGGAGGGAGGAGEEEDDVEDEIAALLAAEGVSAADYRQSRADDAREGTDALLARELVVANDNDAPRVLKLQQLLQARKVSCPRLVIAYGRCAAGESGGRERQSLPVPSPSTSPTHTNRTRWPSTSPRRSSPCSWTARPLTSST
jgi:16S rRNA C967 or C1407 C5-methylase (RsmB/RsmF family)